MDVRVCPQVDRSAPKSLADYEYMVPARFPCGRAKQNRLALGSHARPMPTVDGVTLRHCYRYLSRNLSLPCEAWYPVPTDENGGFACTITELIDPATGPGDKFVGIFCKVRRPWAHGAGKHERSVPLIELELSPDDPNYRLVERCWDCFRHWR